MEGLVGPMVFGGIYRGKKVLLTGHTGFKGSWLAEWLLTLGARVTGFALPPPTEPAIFDQLGLASRLDHRIGDVRDIKAVLQVVDEVRPDFIFHLAAQSLVRYSYSQPTETYSTNVMGTVNLLEAVRVANLPCVIVAVTSDKCYQNREWVHAYREDDPLGGDDPYSSSKAAAELVVGAYQCSYFSGHDSVVHLASGRAGNVIGGGDWAADRIIPDCIRALQRDETIQVRNKVATRPWQHVLEPLSGYLQLAASIRGAAGSNQSSVVKALCSGFNFGPVSTSNRTVADLVEEMLRHWHGRWEDWADPKAVHEASLLNLATDKAFHFLKWQPIWNFEHTVSRTVAWYRHAHRGADARHLTAVDIAAYVTDARAAGAAWSN